MLVETFIRMQLGLKAHTVTKVVETEDYMIIHIDRLGTRLLRCGLCRQRCRKVHSLGKPREWRDLSMRKLPLKLRYPRASGVQYTAQTRDKRASLPSNGFRNLFMDLRQNSCYGLGMTAEAYKRLPRVKRHAIHVARLKKQMTPAEDVFCRSLASRGLCYRFQQSFYSPYYRIVDFYLPDQNLIVEIDGPCHDPEKDRRRDEWFTRVRGIPIIRLTNEQVLCGNFQLPCTIGVR